MLDWKPSAPLSNLQQRAKALSSIRSFFAARDVLEVETPLLGRHTVPDVYIESIAVEATEGRLQHQHFLQTSPEFFMKRLLASGSGSIYQITKAFRQEQRGARHNTEFTLLEWYRLSFSLDQLMSELEQLVQELIGCGPIARLSYRALFQQHLQIDPHQATLTELQTLVSTEIDLVSNALSKTDYLQLLLSHCIEPKLPSYCFIYDYPREQAALSALAADDSGVIVAKRFELFGSGMELANGYLELRDANEQRARFEAENRVRAEKGLAIHALDERLMAALDSGLPDCCGVAVGVDRLVMLLSNAKEIGEVISFDGNGA
ncbi:MAG: EF-P lysine aminoacylase EpmA [Pseudohongiellaceae bacterium]